MSTTLSLLSPVTLGALALPNRVVMAPMTRNRATADGLPTPMMVTYYAQRASAGLIVAEMTQVSPDAQGYAFTPGIHDAEQAARWRAVTDAVHAAGGHIVLQLGHTGRISHPSFQPGGALPVAPSPIAPAGSAFTNAGMQPFVTPRALEPHEMPGIVDKFAAGARWALRAGFDGVELHAANGYLLDQFLRDGTNRRTDAYGGSATNRARLLVEVAEAVSDVWGADRVGVRLSPFNDYNSMSDSDPAATFTTAAALLRPLGLGFLHVIDPLQPAQPADERLTPVMKRVFDGPVIVNGSFARDAAEAALARGEADAVSFATPFIANPDLPVRFARGAALATPDRATFYGGNERGYVDYPALDEQLADAA